MKKKNLHRAHQRCPLAGGAASMTNHDGLLRLPSTSSPSRPACCFLSSSPISPAPCNSGGMGEREEERWCRLDRGPAPLLLHLEHRGEKAAVRARGRRDGNGEMACREEKRGSRTKRIGPECARFSGGVWSWLSSRIGPGQSGTTHLQPIIDLGSRKPSLCWMAPIGS